MLASHVAMPDAYLRPASATSSRMAETPPHAPHASAQISAAPYLAAVLSARTVRPSNLDECPGYGAPVERIAESVSPQAMWPILRKTLRNSNLARARQRRPKPPVDRGGAHGTTLHAATNLLIEEPPRLTHPCPAPLPLCREADSNLPAQKLNGAMGGALRCKRPWSKRNTPFLKETAPQKGRKLRTPNRRATPPISGDLDQRLFPSQAQMLRPPSAPPPSNPHNGDRLPGPTAQDSWQASATALVATTTTGVPAGACRRLNHGGSLTCKHAWWC